MNEQEILAATKAFVQEQMAQNDVGHDYLHVGRVMALAENIAATQPVCDLFVVRMVALLHDIDDYKLRKGEHTLSDFLETLPIAAAQRAQIGLCTGYISYSKYPKPDPTIPLEARIVQDADRLDALGAIGIARTFAYTGAKQRPFYGQCEGATLDHFAEKLCRLSDSLNTPKAKELARQRQAYLNEYVEQFYAELNLKR